MMVLIAVSAMKIYEGGLCEQGVPITRRELGGLKAPLHRSVYVKKLNNLISKIFQKPYDFLKKSLRILFVIQQNIPKAFLNAY